ncbi:MAG: hypothetical protein E7504_03955 [Ruminococcus sp.]|nr:hypothetical protein [Ruminococcus sp.]
MFLIIGFFILLFIILAVICISERKGTEEEKDYPLSFWGFMKIGLDYWTDRMDQWEEHKKKTEKHSQSSKTYDELYTTRKEDHYENN